MLIEVLPDLLAAVGLLATGEQGDEPKRLEESVLVLDLALGTGHRSAGSPGTSDESRSDTTPPLGKDGLPKLLLAGLRPRGDATVLNRAVALLDFGSSSPASGDAPANVRAFLEEGLLLVAPGCIEGWFDIG